MSVLGQIQWADPGAIISQWNIAGAIRSGQEMKLRRRQMRLEEQRIDAALREKQEEAQRHKEILGKAAALQTVERLQRVAGTGNMELYAAANRQMMGGLKQQLVKMGLPEDAGRMPDFIPPDQLLNMAHGLTSQLDQYRDPQKWQMYQQKAAELTAKEAGDDRLNDPRMARMFAPKLYGSFVERLSSRDLQAREIAKAGATRLDLTVGERGKLEEKRRKADDMLWLLDEIDATISSVPGAPPSPEDYQKFFGAAPQMQRKWVEFKDWAPLLDVDPGTREWYGKMTAIREKAGAVNLEKIHEFFGGALTASEIKRATGRILDENMSPLQFMNMTQSMRRTYERAFRSSDEALREGYVAGTRAFGSRVDEINQGLKDREIAQAEQEILQQKPNISETEMAWELQRRGYINP